jgi:hypothetical protein
MQLHYLFLATSEDWRTPKIDRLRQSDEQGMLAGADRQDFAVRQTVAVEGGLAQDRGRPKGTAKPNSN